MKDHATAPHYALLTNFERLPKARLDALLAEVQARPPFEGYRLTISGIPSPTNSDKASALRHAHEAWRETAHSSAQPRPAARAHPTPRLANTITATEANAYLRSLPELPLP